MKRSYIFFIILFIISSTTGILFSCKKDKNKIMINGSVFDPNSNAYVSNANVIISTSKITSGFYNPNYSQIASTTTDVNGNFSFKFDKEKSSGYQIYISKNNYFDNTIDIPDADITAGKVYTPKYDLYTTAYIKLHVKNSSGYNSSDFIAYSYSTGALSCFECCSNNVIKRSGATYDTTFTCKTYGSQNVIINWHVIKSSWDALFADTLFCTPFDTTSYEILY
jgi:hypothetical protein